MSALAQLETSPSLQELGLIVAKMLRRARDAKGLSRTKLGELAGVSPRTIENIEVGQKQVTLHDLFRIAPVLNLDVDTVIAEAKAEYGSPEQPADDDPTRQIKELLQQVAVVLGGRLVFEKPRGSDNDDDAGPDDDLIQDDDGTLSAELNQRLNALSALVAEQGLSAPSLAAHVQPLRENLVTLGWPEVLDVAEDRGVFTSDAFVDEEIDPQDCADAIVFHALYGDSWDLGTASIEKLNKAVQAVNADAARRGEAEADLNFSSWWPDDAVEERGFFSFDDDAAYRDRLARELPPYFVEAVLRGAPIALPVDRDEDPE